MSEQRSAILSACGDLLLHGRYHDIVESGRANRVFSGLEPLLRESDLLVGNMETVLCGELQPRDDKLCLRGDPRYAEALAAAGFSLLTLANNHCMDFGPEGLAQTRQLLESAGIAAPGAGADRHQASCPTILERHGVRLGFLAACHDSTKPAPPATDSRPGIAPVEPERLLASVETLAEDVDHVILLLHWGLEYASYPTPEQVDLARSAIDRGASAVLGHHSHCLQGIETYGAGIIAYSLGNLTDADVDWQGPTKRYEADLTEADRESVLLRLRVDRERIEILDQIPLWLDDDGLPTPARGERAAKIERQLDEYSSRLADPDLEAFWQESLIESRVSAPLSDWWHRGTLWDKIRGFRPGQLVTLLLLARTYMQVRFSRSESKWLLFNSRNDTRPMPASGSGKKTTND